MAIPAISSSNAARAATGSFRSNAGIRSTNAASSGSITVVPPPERASCRRDYFGCILMPASMRIDSAFM